jgi:hypothetical protein
MLSSVPHGSLSATTTGRAGAYRSEPHWALVVDPTRSSTIYAHGVPYNLDPDAFSKSLDSGATWSPVNAGRTLSASPRSPTRRRSPYAGAFAGCQSLDAGDREERVAGTEGSPTSSTFIRSFDSQTLLAAVAGAFRSVDGGDHWSLISASLTGLDQWITAVVAHPVVRGRLFAAGAYGKVFRTDDGGATWTDIGPSQTDDGNNSGGPLAFDPQSDALYFGSNRGVFRSVNSGITWQQTTVQDQVYALRSCRSARPSGLRPREALRHRC